MMKALPTTHRLPLNVAVIEKSGPELVEWDRYVLASHGTTGYHLMGWRNIIEESFGHHTCYVVAKDGSGQVRGILPLVMLNSRLFGRFFVSVPFVNYGGVVGDDTDTVICLVNEAITQAKARGARHIELRNHQPCDVHMPSSRRKVSMRLDLPRDSEVLWKQFPSKLRSQIRRAQKENMVVQFGGSECLDDFYAVFSRCMRDLGTPVYSKRFFDSICRHFPK